jgi:NTP pyrophosphatase (non-canonical NTP hydrolase)
LHINEMAEAAFANAKAKGWVDRKVEVPEQVALLHSECTEMLEAFRNNEPVSWTDEHGKPQGIGSELADILIRAGHYAILNGVDLEAEVVKKMAYNATRPFRHGGKAA